MTTIRRGMTPRWALVFAAGTALLAQAGGCARKPDAAAAPAGLPPLSSAQRPQPVASTTAPLPAPAEGQQALAQALGMNRTTAPSPLEAETTPDPTQTIAGTITLPVANRARVARGDVIFLSARRVGGPPGPGAMMAVQKLQADTFPMPFAISARDAMIPGTPFEGHMSIMVRVDKDGDALTRGKGDIYGQAPDVVVGKTDVTIALDTVQAQDRAIATPDAVQRAMLPPGHP